MSDGSPVPASPEQFDQMREMATMIQERDAWRTKAEALQAEVEHREKMELNALRQRDAMKPVVDAAVAWADRVDEVAHPDLLGHKGRRLYDTVRTYQQTPKKSAAEAVANVAKMMGPVKNCTTCKRGDSVCSAYEAKVCNSPIWSFWEAKSHD
jgi:hypothetical protein